MRYAALALVVIAACGGDNLKATTSTGSSVSDTAVVGTWRVTRADRAPELVRSLCHFYADHTLICEHSALPATWQLKGSSEMQVQDVTGAVVGAVDVHDNAMTFTDDSGRVTTYGYVGPPNY